jgi:predicted Fe-S protein YdhL (DUF1289 family)
MIDQGELFDIPSPCRRICELNNRGYCKGCFRSRDERLNWLKFSDFQRQMIINLCEKRRLKVLAARNPQLHHDDDDALPPQFDMFDVQPPPPETTVNGETPLTEPQTERTTASLFTDTTEQNKAEPVQSGHIPVSESPDLVAGETQASASEAEELSPPQPDQSPLFTEDATQARKDKQAEGKAARSKSPRTRKKADDQQIDLFS